jgi:hypothetical protein
MLLAGNAVMCLLFETAWVLQQAMQPIHGTREMHIHIHPESFGAMNGAAMRQAGADVNWAV